MSFVSQKTQYALRAVFELARRQESGRAVKISEIAAAQDIPHKFLENILGQLKQTGLLQSRRGKTGGYILSKNPDDVTVGDVLRTIQGPLDVVNCSQPAGVSECRFKGACVFHGVWDRASDALSNVYDSISFLDLLLEDAKMTDVNVFDYSI